MELRHSRNRNYRGKWVSKDDPVEDYTPAQAQRLIESDQAYWHEKKQSKSDIYRDLQDRGVAVDWQTPIEVMREML